MNTLDTSLAIVSVSSPSLCAPGAAREGPALAHVPFDFRVGEMLLAAGPYAVESSDIEGMLTIRRADCDSLPILVHAIRANSRRPARPSKLLFYYQWNSYFLAQALTGLN